MKKILFIHHATGWGGAPINMINIINSLKSTKYKVEVLLLKNSIVSDMLKENGISYSIAQSKFYKKYYSYISHSEVGYIKWFQIYQFLISGFLWLLSRYYFAREELKIHDYDIAHLNSSVLTDWLGPAKQFGKVIIHIQEPYRKGKIDFLHLFFTHQMQKHANCIIAISMDNSKRINVPEKTEIIYNYAKIPKKFPSPISYYSKISLYLGGLSYIKGFYTLVDALDYLDKDVKVLFGGDYTSNRKQRFFLERVLRKVLGIGEKKQAALQKIYNHPNATVIGLTHNINKYLHEVCCLVSPFTVSHFSRPIIEAYLNKKTVIGSDVLGMEEIIENRKNGLIIPKNKPKALAEAINYIANNPKLSQEMGYYAYKIGAEKYSPKNIKKFIEIYDNL